MAAVKEQVTEVLLGSTQEPHLSQLSKATFLRHARKDEETGEDFLSEEEFIAAITPANEDYVWTALFKLP